MHYARKWAFVSNLAFTLSDLVSPLRIVCLVPSITELLVEMGLAGCVVGRTGYCIHPAQVVASIPKVGGTKTVNIEKIRKLAPTHLIVNVDENEKSTVDALREWVPQVVVTHPQSPQDNLALIEQLLAAFTAPNAAVARQHDAPGTLAQANNAMYSGAAHAMYVRTIALKEQILERLQRLQQRRALRPVQRVLYLIWQDPWMTVARDTYISRMLDLVHWHTWPDQLGGDGLRSAGAARYPVISGNEPWLQGVDRVLLSSEPYSFNASHVAQVQSWLPHARVQLVDGEMLSWYGSRAILGLDYLEALAEPTMAQ